MYNRKLIILAIMCQSQQEICMIYFAVNLPLAVYAWLE